MVYQGSKKTGLQAKEARQSTISTKRAKMPIVSDLTYCFTSQICKENLRTN